LIDREWLEQIETQVVGTAGAAFAVDLHGRVLAWNRPAELLFGTPAAEAVGRPCAMAVRGTDAAGTVVCRIGCPWLPITESAIRADIPMLVRKGPRPSSRVKVVMRHQLLRNRLGHPVGVLHVAHDVGAKQARAAAK
jgi:PAS domain-containing protein